MPEIKEEVGKNEKIGKNNFLKNILVFLSHYFNFVIIFLVLLILSFGSFFLIKPKYDKISADMKLSNEAMIEVKEKLESNLRGMKKYESVYGKVGQGDLKKVNIMLPDRDNPRDLFTQIEYMILKEGLILFSLEIKYDGDDDKARNSKRSKVDDTTIPGVGKVALTISIRGATYSSFKSLLESLERSARLIDVQSVGFDPLVGEAEINAYTYFIEK